MLTLRTWNYFRNKINIFLSVLIKLGNEKSKTEMYIFVKKTIDCLMFFLSHLIELR